MGWDGDRAGLGPGRVLVVDDHRVNRLALSRLIEQLGFQVETASDGLEALARLEGAGPGFDLVLLDLQLPGLDGLSVAWQLGTQGPRLIAVSADASPDQQAACQALGLAGPLAKPVRLEALQAALGGLAHRGPAPRIVEAMPPAGLPSG